MTWFRVDDKFHDHPKARKAGLPACGLWLRAGTWAADHLTDGFVPEDVLARWGGRDVDVYQLADTLVAVRLWDRDEDKGEAGYRFRKWGKYQPLRADVQAEREAKSEAGVKGNHKRHHVDRGIIVAGCRWCESQADRSSDNGATPPVPSRPDPVPVRSSVAARFPRPVDNRPTLTDDDLDKIAEKTGGDRAHAAKVAADVLDRAGEQVRKPLAYVLRALVEDPARYRKVRGNPRAGDPGECPKHAGKWADSCGGCAADARAVR